MLTRLYNFFISLFKSLWALLKAPFEPHPCKQCACEDYSDEALFMWMADRRAQQTYEDEMLSAGIIGRPLKCSRCEHPREYHGKLRKKILTCEHMPDGGRIFTEQCRRAQFERRERRFGVDALPKEKRPTVDIDELVEGTGVPAKGGDVVVCHYDAFVKSTMERFETSRDGDSFRFTVAAAQVVPGWEVGLKSVKKGARRKIVVPPELAYRGKEICGERNVTIVFDIEVLDIEIC